MFDPTIFDNLKVILEGLVYDYDLSGEIVVTNRQDLLDLATFSRSYTISFSRNDKKVTIALRTNLESLAAEILETKEQADCQISLIFSVVTERNEQLFNQIHQYLENTWKGKEEDPHFIETVVETRSVSSVEYTVTILFKAINENHAEDLPELVRYTIKTLDALNDFL